MKFIDLIKEPSDDKLLKKAKTIFSALRRGKITRKDGVSFSYELGSRTFARVHEGEIELVGSVISIKENTYCPINERYMTELIENKFKMFGINVELRPPTEDQIEKWTGRKPWEEPLNEEIDEYTQKQIKKARTIYKALRRGTIGGDDPEQPHFFYELSESFSIHTTNAGVVITLNKIKIKELNRGCLLHSTDYMGSLIRKRFNLFGIILTNPYKDLYFDYEIESWETPINEEIDRAYLKKLKKKGELVYKLFKKGKLVSDREDGEIHYTYELSDNKLINAYGDEISVSPDNIKIKYHNELTNKFALLPITDSIKKRFHNHGITLNIPRWTEIYIDDWKEPLNEDIDIDKERNRVKTIHKAIRKGIVNFEGNRFRYELPEEYTFHVVDELHLQVTAIKFTFYNKDLSKDNGGGHGLPLKIWRIEGGKDVYLNKMLTAQDVGDIAYNDEYGITNKTGVEYVNVKNKVRNRYRNFDINAIMTTPSDTIMVNEEEEDNDLTKKDRKKIELIYGLFKRGKYKVDDIFYNYVLPEEFWTSNNKETGELIVVLTMDPTQKMKLYAKIKKEDGNLYHREVPVEATQYASLYDDAKKRIKEKFERFNIEIVF